MKTFNTKTCPLCQKGLYIKRENSNLISYRCIEMVSFVEERVIDDDAVALKDRIYKVRHEATHYEVMLNDLPGVKSAQITTLPPYNLVSIEESGRTTINKWPFLRTMTTNFIVEIPTLLPDRSPEKMMEKIKLLILFS